MIGATPPFLLYVFMECIGASNYTSLYLSFSVNSVFIYHRPKILYEGRTESHEQLLFACELGTADEGECGGRWNQLLCYP